MKSLFLLPFAAVAASSSTAYDCRYFDCVTPFVSPAVPLPSGASIPSPAGWPGFPLTFTPQRATVTGFVFGQVSGGGDSGPFLFNGTQTFIALPYPDFVFLDLAGNGLILAHETNDAPFVTDLHGTRRPVGLAFNGPYEFRLSVSGSAVAINRAGDAILMRGVNRFDMFGPMLVERNLTMIFAESTFQPAAIPEPGAAGLVILGIAAVGARRLRSGNAASNSAPAYSRPHAI